MSEILCTGQSIDRPFASNWQMFRILCAGRDNSTRCCLYLADGPDSVCRPFDRQTLCFDLPDVSESVCRPVDRQTFRFELADVSDSVRKQIDRQMICLELPDVSDSVYRPVGRQTVCASAYDSRLGVSTSARVLRFSQREFVGRDVREEGGAPCGAGRP